MRFTNIKNNIFLAGHSTRDSFVRHRKDFIILWLFALTGAIIGGILSGFITKTDFQGCIIIRCISGEYSPFGEIFTYVFMFSLGTCVSACIIFNKFFIIFPYTVSFYYGIKFGQNIVITVVFNKFVGFFSIILFTIPVYAAMIILNSVFYIYLKYTCGRCFCGCFCIKPLLIYMLKMLLILLVILLALLLVLTTVIRVVFAVV